MAGQTTSHKSEREPTNSDLYELMQEIKKKNADELKAMGERMNRLGKQIEDTNERVDGLSMNDKKKTSVSSKTKGFFTTEDGKLRWVRVILASVGGAAVLGGGGYGVYRLTRKSSPEIGEEM